MYTPEEVAALFGSSFTASAAQEGGVSSPSPEETMANYTRPPFTVPAGVNSGSTHVAVTPSASNTATTDMANYAVPVGRRRLDEQPGVSKAWMWRRVANYG